MSSARIFQINVSDGGVPKPGVYQAKVTSLGLVGDRQRNLQVHGGPERALCLFSLDCILALQEEGHPVFPGSAGENLTLVGLDWEKVGPGTRLKLGEGVLAEITRYTTPCDNVRPSFIDGNISRISQEKHPGWARVYARVLQEGEIRVGDPVELF